jgi:hypothetical protein
VVVVTRRVGDGDIGVCISQRLHVLVNHQACFHSGPPEEFMGECHLIE